MVFSLTSHAMSLAILFLDLQWPSVFISIILAYCCLAWKEQPELFRIGGGGGGARETSWHVVKLGLLNVLAGDLDRYLIAFFVSSVSAVQYISIATIVGVIAIVIVSLQRFLVLNVSPQDIVRLSKTASTAHLLVSPVLLGVYVWWISSEFWWIGVGLAFIVKYYAVIRSAPIVFRLYGNNRLRFAYLLQFRVNLLNAVFFPFYFMLPPTLALAAAGKVLSSIPLFRVIKKCE
jgi:hypothetical protein